MWSADWRELECEITQAKQFEATPLRLLNNYKELPSKQKQTGMNGELSSVWAEISWDSDYP
jgi:hypothetical protein